MGLFTSKKKQQEAAEMAARAECARTAENTFTAAFSAWMTALEEGRKAHGWERLTDEVLQVAGDKPTVLRTGLDRFGQVGVGSMVAAYARTRMGHRVTEATVSGDGRAFWEDVQAYVADGFAWVG